MSNFATPSVVSDEIIQLGQRIRIARIRRGLSALDLATKAGINRNTVSALELGKPGTAISTCFTVLWALGLEQGLLTLAEPDADAHGKALEAAKRPTRAGKAPRVLKRGDDYDF
jgi:transcriptional regulator with XRE-family HTH domain